MLTNVCMLLLLVLLGIIVLLVDEKGRLTRFFDAEATNCMRGFWCIIILLVHIPSAYQNPIQDAIGSFAYIGVTFFFMTSSYGLVLAALKNPENIRRTFWKRRLPKLFVPMLIVNVVRVGAEFFAKDVFDPSHFLSMTGFVRQLLFFYMLFWIVFGCLSFIKNEKMKSVFLCILVVTFSLLVYVFKNISVFSWPVESLGFLYGVVLAKKKDFFLRFSKKNWFVKCISLFSLVILLGVAYLKFKNVPFLGDYVLKAVLGFSILLLILLLNAKLPLGNVICRFLGDISYEVYLVHDVVFIVLVSLFALFEKTNSGLFVMLSLIMTVFVSVLVKKTSDLLLKRLLRT